MEFKDWILSNKNNMAFRGQLANLTANNKMNTTEAINHIWKCNLDFENVLKAYEDVEEEDDKHPEVLEVSLTEEEKEIQKEMENSSKQITLTSEEKTKKEEDDDFDFD